MRRKNKKFNASYVPACEEKVAFQTLEQIQNQQNAVPVIPTTLAKCLICDQDFNVPVSDVDIDVYVCHSCKEAIKAVKQCIKLVRS